MKSIVEAKIREELEGEGWLVFHSGYPDFVCFKDGVMRFVEAKQADPLRPEQEKLFALLAMHGYEVEVIKKVMRRPENRDCDYRTVSLPKPIYAKAEEYQKRKGYPSVAQALSALITEAMTR